MVRLVVMFDDNRSYTMMVKDMDTAIDEFEKMDITRVTGMQAAVIDAEDWEE